MKKKKKKVGLPRWLTVERSKEEFTHPSLLPTVADLLGVVLFFIVVIILWWVICAAWDMVYSVGTFLGKYVVGSAQDDLIETQREGDKLSQHGVVVDINRDVEDWAGSFLDSVKKLFVPPQQKPREGSTRF